MDQAGKRVIPSYCFRPWCFVDAAICTKESQERVYRSSYFPFDSGVDLFYSYSTCNSTAEDWLAVEEDIVGNRALGGASIVASTPNYVFPQVFKRDNDGEAISSPGIEYYDNSVPFDGVYPTYVQQLVEISNGDRAYCLSV